MDIVDRAALFGKGVLDRPAPGQDLIEGAADLRECQCSRDSAAAGDIYKDAHQGDDSQAGKQNDGVFRHATWSVEL